MWTVGVVRSQHSPEYGILVELLREQRRSIGMRQADLADAVGVQQSVISKYEAGERRLDLVQLREICIALHTDLPAFVDTFERRLRSAGRRRRDAGNSARPD